MAFSEELQLNIQPALQAIGQVESRLTQAGQQFAVSVARSIDQLRDVRLDIGIDELAISQAIAAAVDAADTTVIVTGDASELTGEVTSAVDAGDAEVVITGDTSAIRAEVDRLDDQIAQVSSRSQTSIGGLFASGAAVAGINRTLDAASALNEAANVTSLVFDEAADDVIAFSRTADQSLGLSQRAALEATNAFGSMLQNLGFARSEALELSFSLATLSADLGSAFNRPTEEASQAIRGLLRGENEQIEQFNVFVNEQRVALEAVRLGLAESTGAVDEHAKSQARLSLLFQQTTDFQGDFANTADQAANAEKRAAAEVENAAAATGDQLLPAVTAAANAVGTLAEAFGRLPDALQTTIVAGVGLAAIVGPVTALARGIGTLGSAAVSAFGRAGPLIAGARGLTTAVGGVGGALTALGPLALGAGIALHNYNETKREATRISEAYAAALAAESGELEDNIDAVSAQELITGRLGDQLRDAGANFDVLTAAVRNQGGAIEALDDNVDLLLDPFKTLEDVIEAAGLSGTAFGDELLRIAESAGLNSSEIIALVRQLDGLSDRYDETTAASNAVARATNAVTAAAESTIGSLFGSADAAERWAISAQGAADAAASLGDLAGLAADAVAGFASDAIGNLPDVADVFSDIASEAKASGSAAEGGIDRASRSMDRLQDRAREAGEALQEALTPPSARDLERAQLGVERALQREIEAQARLAEARDSANNTTGGNSIEDRQRAIADAELDVREATLGVADAQDRLTEVQATGSEADERVIEARERLAEANEAVADSAATAGSAVREAAVEAEVSARQLTDALRRQATDLADFRSDLQRLSEGGFSDLAALVAQQGPEVGDALADELEAALTAGNTAVLTGLRDASNAFNAEIIQTTDFFRETLGPDFIRQSLFIGGAVAQSFGSSLDFEDRIRVVMGLAESALSEEGREVAAVAAAEGAEAAQAYGDALNLEQSVIDAAIEAGRALAEEGTAQARTAGEQAAAGFAEGLAGANAKELLKRAGTEAASTTLVAVLDFLGIASPSRKMREIGHQSVEGFVLGFEDEMELVGATATKLAERSASALGSMNSFEARSGSVGGPATAVLDDSRIIEMLERIALRVGPTFAGPISFQNSPDPGRDIELLARRYKGLQR